MNNTTRIKRNYQIIKFRKLVIVSILIGFLSAFLGVILKKITEHYEEIFFSKATVNPFFFSFFQFSDYPSFIFYEYICSRKKKTKASKKSLKVPIPSQRIYPVTKSHPISSTDYLRLFLVDLQESKFLLLWHRQLLVL